jgi:hypothetical protein
MDLLSGAIFIPGHQTPQGYEVVSKRVNAGERRGGGNRRVAVSSNHVENYVSTPSEVSAHSSPGDSG